MRSRDVIIACDFPSAEKMLEFLVESIKFAG